MKLKQKIWTLGISAVTGLVAIFVLFAISENIMHYHNSFIRRFPTHSAQKIKELELTYNSYYFAGFNGNNLYLGNVTAPFIVVKIDTEKWTTNTYRIELFEKDLYFSSPRIRVFKDDFYVFEGSVPYIFKGNISTWKARLALNSGYHFSKLEPVDENELLVRYQKPGSGESVLGQIKLNDTSEVVYNSDLLQKQFDGVFDTDGHLEFDQASGSLVYTYLYRNEFVLADRDLVLSGRGNTIDTISKAQIKLAKVKSRGVKTFAEPPLTVNRLTAVDNGQLFVNSSLPGKHESDNLWENASIVDIYVLSERSYKNSFAVYHEKNNQMSGFIVRGQRLYALVGTKLVTYSLLDDLASKQAVKEQKK